MPDFVYAQFDQQALDREYSPSSRIDDIGYYLDAYADLSAAARREAAAIGRCNLDLRYGPAARQTLDLFLPASQGLHPLQLFIHGGFWQQLSKNESAFAAPTFLQKGVAFAALNYSLAPEASLRQIVNEVRTAITWLHGNAGRLGFDRERIALSGHSAGAHLCTMMMTTDWAVRGLPADVVKGVCAISGVYDLEPVRLSYVNDVVDISADEVHDLSPVQQAAVSPCPVTLTYGDNETMEFKRQTDKYRETLNANNVPVRFLEVADRNHFDVVLDLCNPASWLAQEALKHSASGLDEAGR